jgi:tRNA nucleotidyltransferase (CCA-adding enzyme)
MLRIELPKHIESVINTLENNDFEAYVVGGTLRDVLMGIEPEDWHLATSAAGKDIKRIFKNHYDCRKRHGVTNVLENCCCVELATFRTDGQYEKFKRASNTVFTQELAQDLKRRDFTMNALAYSHRSGLVDLFDGISDIKNGIIRCVGEPDQRFKEDPVRMLRCIRFAAAMNLKIEDETYEAITTNCSLIKKVSGERICAEIMKTLMADRQIFLLFDTGIGDIIMPEVSKCFSVWQNNSYHIYDVGNHSLETVYNVPKNPILRFAALLHDVGKPKVRVKDGRGVDFFPNHAAFSAAGARDVLTRLKMSNKHKFAIINLIRMHDVNIRPTEVSVRRVASQLKKINFEDLIALKRGVIMAQNPKYMNEQLDELSTIERIYNQILEKKLPIRIKDLAVNSDDMKKIGIKSSAIGRKLRFLLARVVENPSLNTRKTLMDLAIESEKPSFMSNNKK